MFTIALSDGYELRCVYDGLPISFAEYVNHALLAEQIDLTHPEGKECFIALKKRHEDWPSLVVAQKYLADGGFSPGALLVPETNRLFIGAGSRLLCYDISGPARLWEDVNNGGFWSWTADGSEVFMAAELELAAFDLTGKKLWTHDVEPPWTFTLQPDRIVLNVMNEITSLDRRTGEPV